MGSIEAALLACDAASSLNYSKIAREYGVNRSTLSRRHRGATRSEAVFHESQQILSSQQELQLVEYINKLSARGTPPTTIMVRNFAAEIAGEYVGKNWVYRFIDRHEEELKSVWLQGLDLNRKKAESWQNINHYFQLVFGSKCIPCSLLICARFAKKSTNTRSCRRTPITWTKRAS